MSQQTKNGFVLSLFKQSRESISKCGSVVRVGDVLSSGRLSDVAVSLAIALGRLVQSGLDCWSVPRHPADAAKR